MPAYHQRTEEEKRLFHAAGGRAAQASGRAHRYTPEEAREMRARQRRGWEDGAVRDFLNELESCLLPGTVYERADLLRMFDGVMAGRGIKPNEPQ